MDAITIIATLVGIAVGVVTLIKEWPVIVRTVSILREKIAGARLPNLRRRSFIIAFSVGVLASIVCAAFPNLKRGNNLLPTKQPSEKDEFVKNKKTGVIHNIYVCADHLPQQQSFVKPSEIVSSKSIHSSKLVHIASIKGLQSEREALVLNAINESPTSTHLYKYLVSEWGRKKEYSRIHKFLEANINYLNSKLPIYTQNKRLLKKYSKAISELEQRRNKALYLAEIKKLT